MARVSKGDADVSKLMAPVRALLGQGNIAAARIVLESAAETGTVARCNVLHLRGHGERIAGDRLALLDGLR